MTAVLERNLISLAGQYDIPAEEYHRDPVVGGSLSSSGARRILESPARFRYERDHPHATTKAFDLGHAAHELVLGAGPGYELVDRDRWDTNAVKAQVADIRAAGKVPLKRDDYEAVHAMAAALHRHPLARLLVADDGIPEQVLVWHDDATGVWRRAMLDWRRDRIIVDFKTTASASPAAFAKSVANFGYHQQDPYYRDGVVALGLADDPAFVFVVQEKEPPYLVAVYDLDDDAVRIGRERNRRALEVYRDCIQAGVWPGYSTDIETIALPRWVERQHDQEYA